MWDNDDNRKIVISKKLGNDYYWIYYNDVSYVPDDEKTNVNNLFSFLVPLCSIFIKHMSC